jgi:hypothetical protein
MKKLIYISFVFAFLLAFASCEKEEIMPFGDTDEYNTRGGDDIIIDARDVNGESGDRGGDDDKGDDDLITDPDEDEDFDEDENIVDPDEDEDFEEGEGGK